MNQPLAGNFALSREKKPKEFGKDADAMAVPWPIDGSTLVSAEFLEIAE
jgi:hypothetical protein